MNSAIRDQKVWKEKLDSLELIVYDFDGVMTDNKVYLDEIGREQICVNRGDGFAVAQIRKSNINQLIISSEENMVVSQRAKKLKLEVLQGARDKHGLLTQYCVDNQIQLSNVMFVGNDLNDLSAMQAVGIRGCPADAEIEIKEICDWVSSKKGGEGVIRELYREIMRSHNWNFGDSRKRDALPQEILKAINIGEVVAIIPARSGSKGIPDKNIQNLGGFPLIAYTIGAACLSREISRVIVSTDSPKYAEIAKSYGAEVPFLRPFELSTDSSTDMEFMQHAISWLYQREGTVPEYFVHLRITCPFRDPEYIDEAIRKLKEHPEATCLLSGTKETSILTPYKWLKKDGEYYRSIFFHHNDDANLPRQWYPDVYIPNIYVDILKAKTIIEQNELHGKKMLAVESPATLDIDTWQDFEEARQAWSDKDIVYRYLKTL